MKNEPEENRADDDRERERPRTRTGSETPPPWVAWGCGPEGMQQMISRCPCASVFRRHRLAAFAMMVGVALALVALPIGTILGVVAFFRTL